MLNHRKVKFQPGVSISEMLISRLKPTEKSWFIGHSTYPDEFGRPHAHPIPMRKVLVVDDDMSTREVLRTALETFGYDVVEAENGEEGLQLFDIHEIDLVVTDIVMPEVDGIQMMHELHARNACLPIVAISGGALLSAANYLSLAAQTDATCVLAKPFTLSQLRRTVERCFAASAAQPSWRNN